MVLWNCTQIVVGLKTKITFAENRKTPFAIFARITSIKLHQKTVTKTKKIRNWMSKTNYSFAETKTQVKYSLLSYFQEIDLMSCLG